MSEPDRDKLRITDLLVRGKPQYSVKGVLQGWRGGSYQPSRADLIEVLGLEGAVIIRRDEGLRDRLVAAVAFAHGLDESPADEDLEFIAADVDLVLAALSVEGDR